MRKILIGVIIMLIITALTVYMKENDEVIRMGFVPMRDGEKLIESVAPLALMLSKEMGVRVEAFTATNYVGVVEGLGSGQVDFGFIPPFAYVLANSESDAQVILTAINRHGESSYRSQFLVRADTDINSFPDIKNKRVAFVDPSSTSGYLFPGAHLIGEGIDIDKDIEYFYAGGHDKALQLLLNGDVDVATTFVDARQRYEQDFPIAMEETQVLGYTRDIPNISVTVRGSMEVGMQEKIRKALLKIAETEEGAKLLRELFNMHGFVEATDQDYDIIRDTAAIMNVDLKEAD